MATDMTSLGSVFTVFGISSSGAVGAAEATVDNARVLMLDVQASGLSLTLPNATSTDAYAVDVVNVGIHDTEVEGIALRVGASVRFTWTGSSWTLPVGSFLFTGTDGISSGKSGVVPAPAIGDIGRYLRGDGTWADVPLGGVPKYTVTPTAGQTIFTLPTAPTDASSVIMWVNGLGYRNDGTNFSVSDATVTWANLFVLGTTDDVFFTYI